MITSERPNVNLDKQCSIAEAAEILGVDRGTVYNWARKGLIKVRVQRINKRRFIYGREIIRAWQALA